MSRRRPTLRRPSARYAVLGAGALGLTLALRLAQGGDNVVVFERESAPGGLAAGFPLGNAHLEKFYHHLFRTDHDAIRLIQEVGLGDRLMWKRPLTTVLRGDHIWSMDSAPSVLRFSPLSLSDRLRLGACLAYLRLQPDFRSLSGYTASRWIRRWMGDAAYEALWQPLLMAKFGHWHDRIAMPWFWARVHYRTASLGYLRGGFQQLYDTLAHRLVALGSELRLSTEVKEVAPDGNHLRVSTDQREDAFDGVISTLPPRLTLRLVAALPESYRERYGEVAALGAMSLILSLRRRLTDSYWLNLNDPDFPFQPVVEHTNMMPVDDYGGRHIVYFGNYLPTEDELFAKSKEEVIQEFLPAIARLNPDFSTSWIADSWLFRAPFAQPIVTTDYVRRIPPHRTPLAGLILANMFQVYPQDRGQNYSIRLANEVVRNLL